MGSTAPWWGSSIIALVSSLFGVAVSNLLAERNIRLQRRRLSRDNKVDGYPQLATAARKIVNRPVWPVDTASEKQEFDAVLDLAENTAFFGTPSVNSAIELLMTKVFDHQATVDNIRANSAPGHRDRIDGRLRETFEKSRETLSEAVDEFVRAGRRDLEIKGRYHPIVSGQTSRPPTLE